MKMVYGMLSEGTLNEESKFYFGSTCFTLSIIKETSHFQGHIFDNQVKIKIFFQKWQQIDYTIISYRIERYILKIISPTKIQTVRILNAYIWIV